MDLPKSWAKSTEERTELAGKFMDLAIRAGSEIVEVSSEEKAKEWIRQQKNSRKSIIDFWLEADRIPLTTGFSETDMAIIKAQLGVAENGAVWIDDGDMRVRTLPFVVGHLVIVLEKKAILADMQEAYARIDLSNIGFGVFIAGPSKTADIEQSLVIGAHGPLRNTVLIF